MTLLPLERRLRLASGSIVAGLTIQLLTLTRTHPLAFLAFLTVATPLVVAGAFYYLYSLVRGGPEETTGTPQ